MKFFLNLSAGLLLSTAVFFSPSHAMDHSDPNDALNSYNSKITIAICAPCFYPRHTEDNIQNIHPDARNNTPYATVQHIQHIQGLPDNISYTAARRQLWIDYGQPENRSFAGSEIVDMVLSNIPNAYLIPFDWDRDDPTIDAPIEAPCMYAYRVADRDIKAAIKYKPDVIISVAPNCGWLHVAKQATAKNIRYFEIGEPSILEPKRINEHKKDLQNFLRQIIENTREKKRASEELCQGLHTETQIESSFEIYMKLGNGPCEIL
ncbi:MAG: hypothetical protein H0X26_09410 [Alphaproteobacteria bacterium]|nr:hypothetical protein [Alphaproteobacteria bacterium]